MKEKQVAFSISFLKDHIREITHCCVNRQTVDFLIAPKSFDSSYCLELGANHLQQGHVLVLPCTEPAEEIPQTGTHTLILSGCTLRPTQVYQQVLQTPICSKMKLHEQNYMHLRDELFSACKCIQVHHSKIQTQP